MAAVQAELGLPTHQLITEIQARNDWPCPGPGEGNSTCPWPEDEDTELPKRIKRNTMEYMNDKFADGPQVLE
ncbi:hypothetical protein JOB18_043377, partial [Solea senegalensis]